MSAGAPEDEGFLSRWSRRKREVAETEAVPKSGAVVADPLPPAGGGEGLGMAGSAARPADAGQCSGFAPPHPGPPHRKRGEGEEAADVPEHDMVEPPSLDLIDKDFNVAHWLKQNVPETWKLAAMRRAWESDPAIAGFENPARDYALDWNTPGGAPGYGPLTESDDVAAMVRGIFGDTPAAETPSILADDAAGDAMSHKLSSYDESAIGDAAAQEEGILQAEPAAVRLSSDDAIPIDSGSIAPESPQHVYAAAQHSPEAKDASMRIRKRGGGAIPV